MLESIKWQPMCCAEHSAYAEVETRDGGMARLKRAIDGTIHVMRFDAQNRRVDEDYVLMAEAEVVEMLS